MAIRTDFAPGEVLASADLNDTFGAKVDYALPVNAQTGTTYTFVLADGLRLTSASNAGAQTFTIPPQVDVVWLANSVIRVVNYGAGVVTIAGGAGVTVTNAAKTLAQFESAALIRTASNAWTLVPFSGGVSGFQEFEYLVVAGGASGGGAASRAAGGGGAGGFKTGSLFFESGSFTVTVGAGGAATSTDIQGNNGSNSVFATISSTGGGGGGGSNTTAGKVGGSGGGGGATNIDTTFAGGSGTSGEGNAGGAGRGSTTDVNNQTGGGGGGATGVGGNAGVGGPGGNGGAGTASSITGSSVTYAGGGGGGKRSATSSAGTGGAGGGGNGEKASSGGTEGAVNTGGGGGGAGDTNVGKAGGSGIVVLKVTSALTLTIGAGLTSSLTTSGGYNIYTFTAGTDTVVF